MVKTRSHGAWTHLTELMFRSQRVSSVSQAAVVVSASGDVGASQSLSWRIRQTGTSLTSARSTLSGWKITLRWLFSYRCASDLLKRVSWPTLIWTLVAFWTRKFATHSCHSTISFWVRGDGRTPWQPFFWMIRSDRFVSDGLAVVGEKERLTNSVNVRTRDNKVHGELTVEEVMARLTLLKQSRCRNAEEDFWTTE